MCAGMQTCQELICAVANGRQPSEQNKYAFCKAEPAPWMTYQQCCTCPSVPNPEVDTQDVRSCISDSVAVCE